MNTIKGPRPLWRRSREHSHGRGHHTWVTANRQKSNLDNGWWFDQNDEISSVHADDFFSAHGHD